MTQVVLISGALFGAPKSRIDRNGNPYTMAKIRVSAGRDVQFWSVFAFAAQVFEELGLLDDGDQVAIQGAMRAEIYEAAQRARVSLTLIADYVLALRSPQMSGEGGRRFSEVAAPDDDRAFDDEASGASTP